MSGSIDHDSVYYNYKQINCLLLYRVTSIDGCKVHTCAGNNELKGCRPGMGKQSGHNTFIVPLVLHLV